MKKYRIKDEYLDAWTGGNIYNADETPEIVDEVEIERLAHEWEVPVETLMEQVDEV